MADDDWDPFADPADEAEKQELKKEVPVTQETEKSYLKSDGAVPGGSVENEREVDLDGLFGLTTLPPEGPEKAPCLVLICCGTPADFLGGATMDMKLICECAKALQGKEIPYVRFDYALAGRTAGKPGSPADFNMERDVEKAAKWAVSRTERLLILAHSGGSNGFLALVQVWKTGYKKLYDKVMGMCSLSPGMEVWRFLKAAANVGEKEGQEIRENVRRPHSEATIPVKYVCGTEDKMTDVEIMRKTVSERPDKGRAAEIEEVTGGEHAFKDVEQKAAKSAADWLADFA
eukprot:gnl/TRDRNA2_/TRDRNA2_175898_c1_seq3.p1 gnl/TRDRNA2_/TRDRNA2_175898_c1~~gnl/TRDRNA2_/TRDRNA2_175898_c1_seq3.p1  ORF type:complete len:310 (+),score=67.99 gnl/TRDRNA2_/TRDRNA2_175898_c1_seq3:64-930(+)